MGTFDLKSDTFGRGYHPIENDFDATGSGEGKSEGFVETFEGSDSNSNDSSTAQTQIPSYSTVNSSTITYQNEHEGIKRSATASQISHSQFAEHDIDMVQSKRMRLPMHLDERNKTLELDNHHSISPTDQNHSIDKFLAKELNQLSFRERNEINEEIHGVSSLYSIDETPQLISQSIQQLQFEIDYNIPMYQKIAYEKSQQIFKRNLLIRMQQEEPCSVYPSSAAYGLSNGQDDNSRRKPRGHFLNDPEFLLLFLRRELFVIRKAALRLVNFMELVYELWGDAALTEMIWKSQACLTKTELEVFRTGTYQVFQGRDRAGRRIFGNFAVDNADLSVQSRLRLSLYLCLAVLEDVETQKKGAVSISVWHNISMDDFHKRGQCHNRMKEAFPMRISAIHFCLPHEISSSCDSEMRRTSNPQLLHLLKLMFVVSIGAENRPRLRIHVGSTIECMYTLQSFGILAEQIPINNGTGEIETKHHLKWFDLMLEKEKALRENKPFTKIECPMIQDVLFGRGWPIMKHPGNVAFRNIINSKLEEYENQTTKRGKTLIAYSVVCMVKQKEDGARFLKEDSGWWVEVSDDMARQKVSIAFRDARKLKSNRNKHNVDECKSTGTTSTGKEGNSNPFPAKRKEEEMVSQGHFVRQANDSSTSAFLGMDGITGIKRQRCFCNKSMEEQQRSDEANS